MTRKNYESDFVAKMTLPQNMEGADFEIEFATNGITRYKASRKGSEHVNCKTCADGSVLVIFKNHGLSAGMLRSRFVSFLANGDMPDGVQKCVTPRMQDVELMVGAGDDCGDVDFDIAVDYAVIDAYDMAVKAGYKGTREEYIKMISLKPKSSAGNVLHRKCIRYNSYPGEVYSYPAMRFILTLGINKFDVSKFEDNIFLNYYGMPIFKVGDTSHLLIYGADSVNMGYLHASIEAGVLIIDNPGGDDAGLLRLKNGYNFFNEDRSLSIADLKTIICGKLAFPFDLSFINRKFLELKFERLQRSKNEAFCLTGVVYDFFGTEIKLDYEVRKKVSFNSIYIYGSKKSSVKRKRWVRKSITHDSVAGLSPLGIIIGRSLRVSTGKASLFSFDLRIRLANHRHTSVSDWVYLNVRLRFVNETGVYLYHVMWT